MSNLLYDSLFGCHIGDDKPFLIFADGRTISYDAFLRMASRFANTIKAAGLTAGDRLAVQVEKSAEALAVYAACVQSGVIFLPLNTAYKPAEVEYFISDSGARMLIAGDAESLQSIAATHNVILHDMAVNGRGSFTNLATKASDRFAPVPRNGDDLAAFLYTSGTTGPSKGCMVSYNFMCNLARLQLKAGPATAQDVTITPLPLFHMNALCVGVIATALVGARVAILPRFSVSNFWPEVERSGATIASILGGMGGLLAQAPDNDAMKRCYGQIHTARGNPYTEETKEIWRTRFGAKLVGGNGYGLTEACVITSLAAGEYAKPGSSGKRIPDFDVRIVDEDDNELPANQAGEIVVRPLRPDVMFQGYWRRPEATLKAMNNIQPWSYQAPLLATR